MKTFPKPLFIKQILHKIITVILLLFTGSLFCEIPKAPSLFKECIATKSDLLQLNDNYTSQSNASEIAAMAKELLNVDLHATDPDMIIDLAPGYYTIQFESADGATGNGWIGIDDITE